MIRRITERTEISEQAIIASAKSEGIALGSALQESERKALLSEGYNKGYKVGLQETKKHKGGPS